MLTTINQHTDTSARREVVPGAVLTYLYDRSRDSKKSSQPGQDFICFRSGEERLAFCVCDGVSQSFYGDLAARFLGEKLCNWLWEYDPPPATPEEFVATLDTALLNWTDEASTLVQEKVINPTLPPMVRDALERKREVGSEAMFIAGLLDFNNKTLYTCWMGDLRLWLWDATGRSIPFEGMDQWDTKQRWSTRLGAKNGKPHTLTLPIDDIDRITAHTDGLGSRTPGLADILADVLAENSLSKLNSLAADLLDSPGSDDVSVLDIALDTGSSAKPTAVFVPLPIQLDLEETTIIWDEIPDAVGYRISLQQNGRQWTVDVNTNTFFLSGDAVDTVVRVRAVAPERSSPWSEPLIIQPPMPPAAVLYGVGDSETVIAERPFRLRFVIALALLLALLLSFGWLMFTYAR